MNGSGSVKSCTELLSSGANRNFLIVVWQLVADFSDSADSPSVSASEEECISKSHSFPANPPWNWSLSLVIVVGHLKFSLIHCGEPCRIKFSTF